MTAERSIVLGVTSEVSLILIRGFPEYLRDNGWDVHVVSSPGQALEILGAVKGISTHPIVMAREPSPLADLKALWEWVRLLRRIRPDVISVGTPKAGLLGGLAGVTTRVPRRVYLLRGLRLETTRGVRRLVLSILERVSAAAAHEVLAVSPSLMRRAVQLGLVKPWKIRVLGRGSSNGVDTDAYSTDHFNDKQIEDLAANLGILPSVPVIGFVGRLTADKGLAALADAREMLTARSLDHQLLVVGGVDEGQDETILTKLTTSGRTAIITGHVADPRPFYRLMDLLCLPTHREGFPNVVLEAAAMEVPTVTTDATGAVDSVVDQETGRVVPVGDVEALAGGIQDLLLDSSMRSAMGRAARLHAIEHYDQSKVWRKIHDFYAGASDSSERPSRSKLN